MDNKPPKRKPGRPRATETMQTMEHILRTAAGMFMQVGYEKVSLGRVAEASGVTKASVYYYFNNKSELFTKCVTFVLSIAYKQTEKLMNGEGSLRQRLIQVAIGRMRHAHAEFETMMREAGSNLTAEQIEMIRSGEQKMHDLLAKHFTAAMARGELVSRNPLLVAHLYTSAMMVRIRQHALEQTDGIEQLAEQLVDVLLEGLYPRTADVSDTDS